MAMSSVMTACATMASAGVLSLLVIVLLIGKAWSDPILHREHVSHVRALSGGGGDGTAPELAARLAARAHAADARLPLPTPQEIDAIKKVAKILIMLGEQIIPAIIGESPSNGIAADTPHDPVSDR